jgi:putative ABC transport system ATP-binding protein
VAAASWLVLEAQDLHFSYPRGGFALRLKSLQVQAGETLAIMGPSGTGKTTLLRLLSGIVTPQSGTVEIDGAPLTSLSASALRKYRLQKLGLVFQDFALLDYLTVLDNLLLPARLGGFASEALQTKAGALLLRLEMSQHAHHLVSQLSQGERQRVAVARALLNEPTAIFADEPTSSLDEARKDVVMQLLTEEAKAHQSRLIVVTHDAEMRRWFDRVVDFKELCA